MSLQEKIVNWILISIIIISIPSFYLFLKFVFEEKASFSESYNAVKHVVFLSKAPYKFSKLPEKWFFYKPKSHINVYMKSYGYKFVSKNGDLNTLEKSGKFYCVEFRHFTDFF
ncbi:MAG: hypothetical protein ACK4IX_06420, partial [Candidatus Sericytochromatia bacterium]